MDSRLKDLPNDVDELKQLLVQQNERIALLERSEKTFRIENKLLEEKIKDLIARLYSRKSEKLGKFDTTQTRMFDEIEQIEGRGPELLPDEDTDSVSGHKRQKKKNRAIPDDLPRRERIIDVTDEEKFCSCGAEKMRMGEEISEKVDYIPAKAFVWRTIRPKYVCNRCHGEDDEGMVVSIAPMPPAITGKSILAEGLFGHIIVSKFADALPFYRQEGILRRAGVEIGRATMATLAINVYQKLFPLKQIAESLLRKADLLGIDETRLQVLKEPGRSSAQLSYMWHLLARTRDGPIPYFIYRPTKSAGFLDELISGYEGPIITDGAETFNRFNSWPGVIHAGCNSHARRKFVEAEKVSPGNPCVRDILKIYSALYRIEAELRKNKVGPEQILNRRTEESGPLMEKLKEILISLSGSANPQNKLGRGISYTLKEWPKLIKFLTNPDIPIDNNDVENRIRPFCVGRRYWLFSCTPNGAEASAFYYTLIEWAKACKLDPYLYMSHLFRKAPYAITDDDWIALMPLHIKPEDLEFELRARRG